MPLLLFRKQHSLRLVKVITLVCLTSALVAVLSGLYLEYRQFSSAVLREAERESELFAALVSVEKNFDGSAGLDVQIRDRLLNEALFRTSFIQVNLLSTDEQSFFTAAQADGAVRSAQLITATPAPLRSEVAAGSIRLVNKRLYLRATIPLRNHHDETIVAYLEGIYRVPLADLRTAVDRLLIFGSIIFGAVVLCGLLLYPGMLLLHRDLARTSGAASRANGFLLRVLGLALSGNAPASANHHYRLIIYAAALARQQSMPKLRLRALVQAVLLHDIDAVYTAGRHQVTPVQSDDNKPRRGELATFKQTMKRVKRQYWLRLAEPIIHCQHEHYDGSGWPGNMSADRIPLESRILSLVDYFDTDTMPAGPGRDPRNLEAAILAIEKHSGSRFDPVLVAAFAELARTLYPILASASAIELERRVEQTLSGVLPS